MSRAQGDFTTYTNNYAVAHDGDEQDGYVDEKENNNRSRRSTTTTTSLQLQILFICCSTQETFHYAVWQSNSQLRSSTRCQPPTILYGDDAPMNDSWREKTFLPNTFTGFWSHFLISWYQKERSIIAHSSHSVVTSMQKTGPKMGSCRT